jgi:glycine oxidase
MDCDYLIVGQGLAGSILALLLEKLGREVVVIDDTHRHAASKVAAGIINPITGKRLTRSHLINELLALADKVYRDLERLVSARFYTPRVILRLLDSDQEAKRWSDRKSLPEYLAHVGPTISAETYLLKNPFGGFEIISGAQLDIPFFIEATRQRLRSQKRLYEEPFEYRDFQPGSTRVTWCGLAARAVIFCEGYRMSQNPYFGQIELNPAKGEILNLRAPDFSETRIIQRGKWIFRSIGGEIKAGTTFSWDTLDEIPTSKGRNEIEQGLKSYAKFDFEIIDHQAGVRPVVKADNRPLVGIHPSFPRIAVLNGLGSKGALQAPFAAKQLIAKLEQGQYCHPEFDVCRKSLWSRRGFG